MSLFAGDRLDSQPRKRTTFLSGVNSDLFQVGPTAMDANSIFRLSGSNTLDLLKFATVALHPLVDGFYFCYQHGYLLKLTLSAQAIYSPEQDWL